LYSIKEGKPTPIAGGGSGAPEDGVGQNAVLLDPISLSLDLNDCCASSAEMNNHCIRRVTLPKHWFAPQPMRISHIWCANCILIDCFSAI
jgi:hypothetical protein